MCSMQKNIFGAKSLRWRSRVPPPAPRCRRHGGAVNFRSWAVGLVFRGSGIRVSGSRINGLDGRSVKVSGEETYCNDEVC